MSRPVYAASVTGCWPTADGHPAPLRSEPPHHRLDVADGDRRDRDDDPVVVAVVCGAGRVLPRQCRGAGKLAAYRAGAGVDGRGDPDRTGPGHRRLVPACAPYPVAVEFAGRQRPRAGQRRSRCTRQCRRKLAGRSSHPGRRLQCDGAAPAAHGERAGHVARRHRPRAAHAGDDPAWPPAGAGRGRVPA
ncbi:hypothetical protein G6F61_013844 [Rhizopus arrhizus]|nr:hypothetical protein G6F61_013844 [Rhizopus arrhizus]